MKVKVAYKLYGTTTVTVKDTKNRTRLLVRVEEQLMKKSVQELFSGIEGMPLDVEGDAIAVEGIETMEGKSLY